MDRVDGLDVAIQRVEQALDRVRAAWEAEHPDLPWPVPEPSPPAWHPDPKQAPATTRQSAGVARLRAESLYQQALQVSEQAKQMQRATQALHAYLQRSSVEGDPASFIRVGPDILLRGPRPSR